MKQLLVIGTASKLTLGGPAKNVVEKMIGGKWRVATWLTTF